MISINAEMYKNAVRKCVVTVGTIFLVGCIHVRDHIPRDEADRITTVEAIMSQIAPELDREFNNRTTYSLTMLQIMDAANQQGVEGRDMSALLDEEMIRQFQARRSRMLRELRDELFVLDRQALQTALRESSVPTTTYPRPWALQYSLTLQRTWRRAGCVAMRKIPFIWAARKPERRPFSYDRFGITRVQRQRLCFITKEMRAP